MLSDELTAYIKTLDLNRERWEKILDYSLFLFVLFQIVIISFNWNSLPETIPTHFNIRGEADGYGGKGILLLFPILSVAIYFLMSIAYKWPQFINIPWSLTKENIIRQIRLVWRMLLYLKIAVMLIFSYLTYQMIQIALHNEQFLGHFFLGIVIFKLGVIIWYFRKSYLQR